MDLRAIPPCRFVCAACGKTSSTRYGLPNTDHDPGWDASCMLNAVLCKPTGHSPGRTFSGPHAGTAWHVVEDSVEGVHYEAVERTPIQRMWDQSDGVVCPTCGGDFTLCEHGNEVTARMTPAEQAYKQATEARYVREIDDGWVIVVQHMAFSDRVCLGRIEDTSTVDDGWCYPDRALALRAAQAWDGKGDPPDGWIKHLRSGRCRVDGDPKRESIGWGPKP